MGEIIDVYGDAIKVFFGVALAGGLMAACGYLSGQTITNVFTALLG